MPCKKQYTYLSSIAVGVTFLWESSVPLAVAEGVGPGCRVSLRVPILADHKQGNQECTRDSVYPRRSASGEFRFGAQRPRHRQVKRGQLRGGLTLSGMVSSLGQTLPQGKPKPQGKESGPGYADRNWGPNKGGSSGQGNGVT